MSCAIPPIGSGQVGGLVRNLFTESEQQTVSILSLLICSSRWLCSEASTPRPTRYSRVIVWLLLVAARQNSIADLAVSDSGRALSMIKNFTLAGCGVLPHEKYMER